MDWTTSNGLISLYTLGTATYIPPIVSFMNSQQLAVTGTLTMAFKTFFYPRNINTVERKRFVTNLKAASRKLKKCLAMNAISPWRR
ncbi:hypothetical protein TNCV_2752081 [Trichonephila clavipes]|nr:hypothetical protein TNCV_2752081 [Trichonephila clavipes]